MRLERARLKAVQAHQQRTMRDKEGNRKRSAVAVLCNFSAWPVSITLALLALATLLTFAAWTVRPTAGLRHRTRRGIDVRFLVVD